MFALIHSIRMHTFVFNLYVYQRSVIDHYEIISLYTKSFCTEIRLHACHFLWPQTAITKPNQTTLLRLRGEAIRYNVVSILPET